MLYDKPKCNTKNTKQILKRPADLLLKCKVRNITFLDNI